MAKHVILENYTFNASTKTIVVNGKYLRKEQLLLITNVTAGVVIYNFSDPTLLSTVHSASIDSNSGQETSTITVVYNTSGMANTDKLAILYEETYHEIIPSEVMRDPVEKLRVSQPQSLIDTDFEYGVQPTKWESLNLLNNRPSAFYDPTTGISGTASTGTFSGASGSYTITGITAAATGTTYKVTIAINNTTGLTVGQPFFLQGTTDTAGTDGWWIINELTSNTNISFYTPTIPAASSFDSTKTYLYPAYFFSGAIIPVTAGTSAITAFGTTSITVNTAPTMHGLRYNDWVHITGVTSGTSTIPHSINGTWQVTSTPNQSTFTFTSNTTVTAGTYTTVVGSVIGRSTGYVEHRAFDGAVQFTNLTPYHGYQVIRQTRRYFRYQSGKGIQFSTGSMLKPALNVDTITWTSNVVTVTTKIGHGLLTGALVQVSGASDPAYNGIFSVTNPTVLTFQYAPAGTPASSPAVGIFTSPTYTGYGTIGQGSATSLQVTPYTWYGSQNRVGMFDFQNGFFFEFDGQNLSAVRRNATTIISGNIAVTSGSQTITGTATKFSSQLKPGDNIVIRGMLFNVTGISSDTQMFIAPEYRGVTISAAYVTKVVETRYQQSSWNIDKCDGTGASGFNVDLTKMQMFYMDYTWYGAGAIRFGFKNNRGEVVYCHRIANNNVNYKAYMRSGNLPARYETSTVPPYTYLTGNLLASATTGGTILVNDTTANLWPASGTVVLSAPGISGNIEYVTYSAKTNTSFTINTRNATGGNATAQTWLTNNIFQPIKVELFAPQNASVLNHWGSSVIMDGRFDDDKSYVFNTGMNTPQYCAVINQRYPLISVRLAPSVDNGVTGLLGSREILNRMQLTLRSMDCFTANSAFRIDLILNGRVNGSNNFWSPVGGSSLAQYCLHGTTVANAITGGENVYSYFTNNAAATSQDLNLVRDIGTSILGGGNISAINNVVTNMYPDGPDMITVCATPVVLPSNINARISWTEAQA